MHIRRRILLSLVGIAGVITVFSSSVFGQIDSATIQGIVHDEQGGIIPGVEIVVTNVQTNERFQTLTNDHGFYAAPKLKIGQYQVQASLSGFKTGVRSGITLEVQKVARIDFTLQIGEISETVTITGETSLLESEKAAVGQVIESHAIANLPLNGRSYVQLARLAVGVIEPPRGDRGGDDGFVANGVKAQLNDFRLDGIDNNARTPGVQQRTYAVVRPALDSIQEFRVETHNFSAEYGRAAGAVVNASIKSGTNAFHGSLFEFHRNDNLDARDFFADPDDAKPFLLLNQFGGTIGGPLVHDHTFFLFSFGASRERRGDTIVSTVPTEAMRRGDFSGIPETIFDPATTRRNPAGKGFIRDPFAGKQIPPNRLDPVAKRVMDEFLLMPNGPGLANNFVLSPNEKRDIERYTTRIDTNLTDRDKLFGRYIIIDRTFIFAKPFWVGRARKDAARSQSLAIGETHTFSPTVVNQLRLGYSRLNPIRDVLVEEQLFEQFGFKGINPAPDVHGLPGLNISGFVRLGNGAFQPNQKIPESYEITDNLSFVRGNHSLTTGLTFRHQRAFFNISDAARGIFVFNGVFTQNPQRRGGTGSGFADYLLGLPHVAQLSNIFDGHLRNQYWGFYIQDDWKVTPKLTLNLGLRYELFYPEHEINDKQLNFVIGPNKLIVPNNNIPEGIPADLVMSIPSGVGTRNLRKLDKNNFAPRMGFAYRLSDRTVIRAGGGIFYAEGIYTFLGGSGRLVGNPPWRIRKRLQSDRTIPTFFLQQGFAPDLFTVGQLSPNTTWRSHALDIKSPYASHWSLSIQHELPGLFLADVGYTGSKGTNFSIDYDINEELPGPGSVRSRRPIQGFGDLRRFEPMISSNYHALLLKAERRFSDGLAFLAAYTLGKAIDDMGELFSDRPIRDARNVKAERGRTNFDMRQRFTSYVIYDLPWGTNKRWDLGSSWLNNVLGNWRFNLISTLRTGQPFTPNMVTSSANTGHPRPHRVRDGNLSADQRSIDRWFDKEAFVRPNDAIFEFGDSGRNILEGPGAVNFDLGLAKRVPVALGEQGEVIFRVEFFNAFNTPQFARPHTRIDLPQGATIRSLSHNMREIQFGLRIVF